MGAGSSPGCSSSSPALCCGPGGWWWMPQVLGPCTRVGDREKHLALACRGHLGSGQRTEDLGEPGRLPGPGSGRRRREPRSPHRSTGWVRFCYHRPHPAAAPRPPPGDAGPAPAARDTATAREPAPRPAPGSARERRPRGSPARAGPSNLSRAGPWGRKPRAALPAGAGLRGGPASSRRATFGAPGRRCRLRVCFPGSVVAAGPRAWGLGEGRLLMPVPTAVDPQRTPASQPAMEDKPMVVSKQKTDVVCGVPTQVVCTAFASHILVVVTQFGKMGTLVSLEPSSVAGDLSRPVVSTRVLLGQDEPLIHVFAKNLVAFVSQEAGNRAVLLAVAVKDKSLAGLQALKALIRLCQVW
uniref:Uncharacterized protein n=2 Tax=Oryctolagus cuniculus TaxID=9986 RepID=A0A5F9DBH6_RABIT